MREIVIETSYVRQQSKGLVVLAAFISDRIDQKAAARRVVETGCAISASDAGYVAIIRCRCNLDTRRDGLSGTDARWDDS
jgi:hypothetical protein